MSKLEDELLYEIPEEEDDELAELKKRQKALIKKLKKEKDKLINLRRESKMAPERKNLLDLDHTEELFCRKEAQVSLEVRYTIY
jgi:hypothetical protein